MPVLFPPPMPRFSCSITVTSGKRSRTSATVPSVDPLSTTTVSWPRTDSRHCSMCPAAFQVTTTTERSSAIGNGHRRPAEAFPQDHHEPRHRQEQCHQEEHEPGRERVVGTDAEPRQEADEERLSHPEPVDRERDEHDQEEERPEYDVR